MRVRARAYPRASSRLHLIRRVDAGAPDQQEPHYLHVAVLHRDHESCPAVLRGQGICGAGRVKGAAAEGESRRPPSV